MKRWVVFINSCMLMGIVLMARGFISAWESFEEAYSLEQIIGSAGREAMEGLSGVALMELPPPFSDFIFISERNLFAEDRRPPAVEEEEEEPKWGDRSIGTAQVGQQAGPARCVCRGWEETSHPDGCRRRSRASAYRARWRFSSRLRGCRNRGLDCETEAEGS